LLRFAPSPTGDMHIGNLRVALFNHILSKQLNEDLIIRIEDTDKERNIEGKDKEILEVLSLFSIDYTQVLYQSENVKHHTQMAMQLLLKKKAFNCFCSSEALDKDRDEAIKNKQPYRYSGFCENLSDEATIDCLAPFTVRIKKPENNIKFTDAIKGDFDFEPFDVDSFVILRHDKTPTYNFACAIDDMLCNISTVIRGEDHMSNTPKQIHIRNSLGYSQEINYCHLPIILNLETGKKMSKRDDASSVKWLVDEGYLPVAISNYLVLLGYNPPTDIFTLEEAMNWFDISKISKAPAKFDITKLKFINREHIKLMDEMRLSKLIGYADKDIGILAKIYIEECDTIKEIKAKIDAIFSQKETLEGFEEEFIKLKECLKSAPFIDDFNDLKKYITEKTGLKGKLLFMPLRFALTGATKGPNLSEIYPLIKNYLGEIV
jgi:glutamyl-tRNA synthetase